MHAIRKTVFCLPVHAPSSKMQADYIPRLRTTHALSLAPDRPAAREETVNAVNIKHSGVFYEFFIPRDEHPDSMCQNVALKWRRRARGVGSACVICT